MRLDGQVALVTGGGSGIGAAICDRFAAEGAAVIVADVDGGAASRVAATIAGARAVEVDVTDSAAVEHLVAGLGRLDILVNSAGVDDPPLKATLAGQIAAGEPIDITRQLTDERWRRMMAVNLDGTFFCVRAALGVMLPAGRGAIVNIASSAGVDPAAGLAHYCVSKAGVIALTRSVAKEVAGRGVRVNALAPGAVDTPMNARTPGGVGPNIPIGRRGTAAEIAAAALFLASDEASYVTGEIMNINGGTITG